MEDILPRVFREQREMAEGAGEQWNGVGARGQRCYVTGDSPAPLTGLCGLEAPGQILQPKYLQM